MNPARLLIHFSRLAETPGAIPRLRRFILDLAVRGKLVEHDPKDNPAPTLLAHMEKSDAIFTKGPGGWISGEFGNLLEMKYGKGLEEKDRKDQGAVPVFGSNGIVSFTDQPLTTKPTIIIGRKGSAGALKLCEGPSWTTDVAYFLEPPDFFDIRFLFFFLQTLDLNALGKGVKPGLSRSDAYRLAVAVPPLAEQHRIVAKVDELMALCDRLEGAQSLQESRRDQLVGASLYRLTSKEDQARFHLQHLPRLTARPMHIIQLRQTILDLAVRGKLVHQDPNDEPASELLERIKAEKQKMWREGTIEKERLLPSIPADAVPFDLPQSWKWTRLGSLSLLVTSGSRDWAQHYSAQGAIFLRMGNLSRNSYRLRLDKIQHVMPPKNGEGTRTKLAADDILISITGEVGLLGLIPPNFGDAYINQHVCMVRLASCLRQNYIPEFLRSSTAQDQFNAPQRGIKNSFRLTDVTELLVALPPLSEQLRIVAKVEELLALCDRLEAQLTATQIEGSRFLEAVLDDALSPGEPTRLK